MWQRVNEPLRSANRFSTLSFFALWRTNVPGVNREKVCPYIFICFLRLADCRIRYIAFPGSGPGPVALYSAETLKNEVLQWIQLVRRSVSLSSNAQWFDLEQMVVKTEYLIQIVNIVLLLTIFIRQKVLRKPSVEEITVF